MKQFCTAVLLTFLFQYGFAQQIQLLTTDTKTSIRGLSVVTDQIIWVSGSSGMVGKSVDSGRTWKWMQVPGFEKREFRDIEAFDASTAVIIAIAEPAQILRTTDGGEHWTQVYENKTSGMFLDAMDFWDDNNGIVLGDPINNHFFMARTSDGGKTWQQTPTENTPVADSGEACFASSGTNIRMINKNDFYFISGVLRSRLFINKKPFHMPIVQGKESTGANSIALSPNKKQIVVVGGDFAKDTTAANNCYLSFNKGKIWQSPQVAPHGYRSCVEFITNKYLLTCGTSGVDFSADSGNNWSLISKESFHVCRKAKKGTGVFLAGSKGKVARLNW